MRALINNRKLRTKLVGSYLLLVLIPMIVLFLFFQYRFIYRLEDNALRMEKAIMNQAVDIVESRLGEIEDTANLAAQSETIHQILTASEADIGTILENQRKRDDLITYMENIRMRIDNSMIQDIKIFCDPDLALFDSEIITDYGIFESNQVVASALWYGILMSRNQNSIVSSVFYLTSKEVDAGKYIAYIKKIPFYVSGEKKIAFAAVYFNRDYLLDILDTYGEFEDSGFYIMDEKDNLVMQQESDGGDNILIPYQNVESVIGEEKTFAKVSYGDYDVWAIYYRIQQANWIMVYTVPTASILSGTQRDEIILAISYGIIAVGMCLLMLLLADSIIRRVQHLRDRMIQVKDKLPEKLDTIHYEDEIGQLTDSYNVMVDEIYQLMDEKTNMLQERNEMEMNFLRSQINPHFLYNTLDMINWYAVRGKTSDVTESIQTLAGFYKLSLNNGEVLTNIEKEILLIEKYIEIQKRRSMLDIEFFVDVPEDMLEQKIPQFILQPLVENSIKYGILEKETPEGIISITGWMDQKEMVLVLTDDGVGMTEDVRRTLFEKGEKERQGRHHIGLWNIYRRLTLFYGEQGFSMECMSSPGEGTSMEIHLSYDMKGEEAQKIDS